MYLINYTRMCPLVKSHHFGKCSHIPVHYNIYIYTCSNILWRPHDPSQNLGVGCNLQDRHLCSKLSNLTPFQKQVYSILFIAVSTSSSSLDERNLKSPQVVNKQKSQLISIFYNKYFPCQYRRERQYK